MTVASLLLLSVLPQPGGFTVEAVNNNSSMVMTGMRVQLGSQAIERAPSYLEIFGRTMQVNLTRARWFDFPFTREEALQADKKLCIFSKRRRVFTTH
jgi:E3 ubiquitin-protein ligase UBR4